MARVRVSWPGHLLFGSRKIVLKAIAKLLTLAVLVGLIGCSKSGADPNKSLKPLDPGVQKPQAIKDKSKLDSGQIMK
jgi:hypothetical protein